MDKPELNMTAILPEQYHFVGKSAINPEEIIDLRESVGWKGDTNERWQQCIDQSLAVIAVRNTQELLIGMACLAGNLRHAVLCDLAVHPDYQKQGIGAAILAEQLHIAKELSVSYLYTELADTNPFRENMLQLGFRVTGNSLFRET